jgi:hypothetical protein
MTDHPITPPPELVQQWADMLASRSDEAVFSLAAQWGADQELEACCEYLVRCAQWEPEDVDELRAARRPKPPSLKEQALEVLGHVQKGWGLAEVDLDTIRRALESISD